MSESAVLAPRSADILAFPVRPPAARDGVAEGMSAEVAELHPAPAPDPNERLRRALASLEAALAAQRTALADWRGALTELHGSLGGLGTTMQGYNAALGGLALGVTRLNEQARSLEATADAALRHAGAEPTA